MTDADIRFYFDPVCPFAWMTSKWVRQVTAQRDYTVDWRFISLRMINAAIDYDSHFPAGYEAGHKAGLKLLRVAARVRADYGRNQIGPLYETGKDVGTPIIHFQPPDGVAFFGPVISRLPDNTDAIRLWDHVIGLATFPGFAELKRSLRERPQLRSFGVETDQVGIQEDWHGGSRQQKR